MARSLRWMLLMGVVAAGAVVGPLGSEARAQIFYRGSGNRYSGYYAMRGGFYPGLFPWGIGGWGFGGWGLGGWGISPWVPWGGFYGGYFGGYYPFGFYYGDVLSYPCFTYTLYPFYTYVPSWTNAPYPKVIELRNAPAPPAPRSDSGAGPEPGSGPDAKRTVVYRANLNSVSPFDRSGAEGRRVVLGFRTSR